MTTPLHPEPPFPKQKQPMPGLTAKMRPVPDHGEESYKGPGRLEGKKAVITGADSGIGRAVAIAYAREGADVLISYLEEHEDAEETKRLVEAAGQKALLVSGDIQNAVHCRTIIEKAVSELGGVDIQACSLSMDLLHLAPGDLDPLVDGVEGVTAFYLNAGDGQVVLI